MVLPHFLVVKYLVFVCFSEVCSSSWGFMSLCLERFHKMPQVSKEVVNPLGVSQLLHEQRTEGLVSPPVITCIEC